MRRSTGLAGKIEPDHSLQDIKELVKRATLPAIDVAADRRAVENIMDSAT